jgi:hypothetical protein
VWFGSRPEPLTPALPADRFHALFDAGIDGILCSAADWQVDLDLVEHQVLPELRRRGVVAPLCQVRAHAPGPVAVPG